MARKERNAMIDSFKPKRVVIRRTFYTNTYLLMIQGESSKDTKDGYSYFRLYGKKKTIRKAFSETMKVLGLPDDNIPWKRVDERGRVEWSW
jgi:predicted nucleotidyltransferase